MRKLALSLFTSAMLAACGGGQEASDVVDTAERASINPEDWPEQRPVIVRDPEMEARIADLLSRMTLEEKVGQVIQADISSVTPEQVREYNLGAVLNGGGSAPGGDNRTTPDKWLALADEFWEASTDTSDGGVGIPVIWGTDAVHGHSNILGATLFPHNIGLGMANDPDLLYEIGRVTALEVRATGLDWTFAPTVAVARNDRWGRAYESYSEDPAIVTRYAARIVEGLQGVVGTDDFLDESRVLASAKHFVGDGATTNGRDQGDAAVTESELRDIHAAGYPPAIRAGAQTVMASYNSFHGKKMHGDKAMLTDVLVGRMGFDGFVIGDWNGHGQVEGCSNATCPAAINAGLDMFMAPDSWDELYVSTLAEVQSGEISMARLDEAVSRILRVKMRAGVFEAGLPSSRPYAGNFDLLGSPEHRAIARDAVRKSLVLLKNEDGLLPLLPDANVLVAGDGAHDIGKQSGGWTLNWQGSENLNEHFPNGTSIFEGLKEVFEAGGGTAVLSEDGSYSDAPDVAIVVFGEDPYAEFHGDRPAVDFAPGDSLELLRKFQAAGIPTVSVFLSGRPLWTNPEINASNAFVAAWLPGSEGGGIADVLVGDADGYPRFDFRGRLSYSWPRTAVDDEVNVGDDDYDPLFPYGHGLGYEDDGSVAELSEESGLSDDMMIPKGLILESGDPAGAWRMQALDAAGWNWIANSRGASATGAVRVMPADREREEDTIIATWTGDATIAVSGPAEDFARETNADMALRVDYKVHQSGESAVRIGMGHGPDRIAYVDVTDSLAEQSATDWQTGFIKLSCFEEAGLNMEAVGNPLVVTAGAGLVLQLGSAEVVGNPGDAGCEL
ncbi:MAG: glycoside hydrolase family 3 N-terminal domain-containing protein [Woeseiaceae bacterium]|nr:glycoside hydrolase family 3 N-terminal domain-containing protein [Woeseiaceae bacterium]